MSVKPNFATMTSQELRAYILDHRDDEAALHAYLDRRHSENPNSQMYTADDDVGEAIAAYLRKKQLPS